MFKMNRLKALKGLRIGIAVTLIGALLACTPAPQNDKADEAFWWKKRRRTRIAEIVNAPDWCSDLNSTNSQSV